MLLAICPPGYTIAEAFCYLTLLLLLFVLNRQDHRLSRAHLWYYETSDDRTTVTGLSTAIELISTNIIYSGLVATTTSTLYCRHVSLGSFNDQETQWLLQTDY